MENQDLRFLRMALHDTSFSFIGYLFGVALIGALVVFPVVAMGMKNRSVFQRKHFPFGAQQ
jgi:hypothetical protein